jgi:hypothetical protein
MSSFFTMVGGLVTAIDGVTILGLLVMLLGVMLAAAGITWAKSSFHGIHRYYPSVHKPELANCFSVTGTVSRKKLQEKYPSTKFYDTVEELLEAHPVKQLDLPKPKDDWIEEYQAYRANAQRRARLRRDGSGYFPGSYYSNYSSGTHDSKPTYEYPKSFWQSMPQPPDLGKDSAE